MHVYELFELKQSVSMCMYVCGLTMLFQSHYTLKPDLVTSTYRYVVSYCVLFSSALLISLLNRVQKSEYIHIARHVNMLQSVLWHTGKTDLDSSHTTHYSVICSKH